MGPRERLRGAGRNLRYLWVLGLLFYAAAVYAIGPRAVLDAFTHVDWRFIAGLMAVEVAALWLRVLKWGVVLGRGQSAVAVCFMSKAGGNLSPARVGEFAPLLLKRHRTAQVGAWIAVDRMLEAAATLVLGLGGILVLSADAAQNLMLWVGAVLAAMALATVALTRARLYEGLRDRFGVETLVGRGAHVLAQAARAARELANRLPLLALITVVAKLLDIAVGMLLYGAMGYSVSIAVLALAQCVHGLTSVVPVTPNATGIPYAAAAAVLHQLAGVPADVLALAIPIRFAATSLVFWVSFAAGVATYRADAGTAANNHDPAPKEEPQ